MNGLAVGVQVVFGGLKILSDQVYHSWTLLDEWDDDGLDIKKKSAFKYYLLVSAALKRLTKIYSVSVTE